MTGPTRRIVTARRTGPLRFGAAAIALGIVMLIVGAVLTSGTQALEVATAEGRARVGGTVTFDAKEETYAITLTADPLVRDFTDSRLADLQCTVSQPDGTSTALDPRKATSRTSGTAGIFAADFKGQEGRTTVDCSWSEGREHGGFFSVAKAHKGVELAGTIALVAGVAVALAGVAGVTVGIRGRPQIEAIAQTDASASSALDD